MAALPFTGSSSNASAGIAPAGSYSSRVLKINLNLGTYAILLPISPPPVTLPIGDARIYSLSPTAILRRI